MQNNDFYTIHIFLDLETNDELESNEEKVYKNNDDSRESKREKINDVDKKEKKKTEEQTVFLVNYT